MAVVTCNPGLGVEVMTPPLAVAEEGTEDVLLLELEGTSPLIPPLPT